MITKTVALITAGVLALASLSACSVLGQPTAPAPTDPTASAPTDRDATIIFYTQGPSGSYVVTYFDKQIGDYATERADFKADSLPAHRVLVVPKGTSIKIDISVQTAGGKKHYEQLTSCEIVDTGPGDDTTGGAEKPSLTEAHQYGTGDFGCTWENK